ncbi:MAG TPA: uracil-DNA glycosylase [Gammaproteobacteria bacterium]|nr:uracil-DNA glycosylase [Gammaproteobacteria bacterium]
MSKSERRHAALAAMGVTAWVPRGDAAPPVEETATPPAPAPVAAGTRGVDAADWDSLAAAVAACQRCELHKGRTQTVFGVGARDARWMVIGEAPGQEEDRRGEPFVGRAGQLLNSMLAALGFRREQVYIANILKCRPPNNRDPRPEEVACCEGYLQRQIALVNPAVILCVGRIAAQNLLKTQTPIAKLRGQRHVYGPRQTPVIVTYHPAYLLRSPAEKRRAWQDLLFAQRVYAEATRGSG